MNAKEFPYGLACALGMVPLPTPYEAKGITGEVVAKEINGQAGVGLEREDELPTCAGEEMMPMEGL